MNQYQAEFKRLKEQQTKREERRETLQCILDRMNGRDGYKPTKMEF